MGIISGTSAFQVPVSLESPMYASVHPWSNACRFTERASSSEMRIEATRIAVSRSHEESKWPYLSGWVRATCSRQTGAL